MIQNKKFKVKTRNYFKVKRRNYFKVKRRNYFKVKTRNYFKVESILLLSIMLILNKISLSTPSFFTIQDEKLKEYEAHSSVQEQKVKEYESRSKKLINHCKKIEKATGCKVSLQIVPSGFRAQPHSYKSDGFEACEN